MVKIEHYLELKVVLYGHGLYKNVGRPTDYRCHLNHVNAEGQTEATVINVRYYKHYYFVNFC